MVTGYTKCFRYGLDPKKNLLLSLVEGSTKHKEYHKAATLIRRLEETERKGEVGLMGSFCWSSKWGSSKNHSNLQSFLSCITPIVLSHQLLPKTCIQDLKSLSLNKCKNEYFTLGDLWNCYEKWSVYGAGVPIILNNGEMVMQYYVPYLSAIQIFISKSPITLRHPRKEIEIAEYESDSWSEKSGSGKLSRSLSNNSSSTWDGSEDSNFEQEGLWPVKDHHTDLYFEYFERCSPYARNPLLDKVKELSRTYPGLMSFKSSDLSPASWISVAWYPIYHIPSGRNVRELSACFLTYHTLSSSFQETVSDEADKKKSHFSSVEQFKGGEAKGKESNTVIPLPPFALASYKMHGDLWINPNTSDQERILSLFSAAASWLDQLTVDHHDFNYFSSHSTL